MTEPEWINRTKSILTNVIIINDANVMLSILDRSVGLKLSDLLQGVKVGDINKATKARAVRFARFVKRLKKKKKSTESLTRDADSKIVICQMASAFLVTGCLLLAIDMNEVLSYPKEVKTFLEKTDDRTGTMLKKLEHGSKPSRYKPSSPQKLGSNPSQVSQDNIDESAKTTTYLELQSRDLGITSKVSFPKNVEATSTYMHPVEKHGEVTIKRDLGHSHMPLKKRRDPCIIKKEIDLAKEFAASALMELTSPDRAKMRNPAQKKVIGLSMAENGNFSEINLNDVSILDTKSVKQISVQNKSIEQIEKSGIDSSVQELNQSITSAPFCTERKKSDSVKVVGIEKADKNIFDLPPSTITKENQGNLPSTNNKKETNSLPSSDSIIVPATSMPTTFPNTTDGIGNDVLLDGGIELKNVTYSESNGPNVTARSEIIEKGENFYTQHINIADEETNLQNNDPTLETDTRIVQGESMDVEGMSPVSSAKNGQEGRLSSNSSQSLAQGQSDDIEMKKTPSDETLSNARCIVVRKQPEVELPWKASISYKVEPMSGWNSGIHAVGTNNVWADSRKCCLCNTCGDDDAGQSGEGGKKRHLNGNEIIHNSGSGRLLPIPGGGWIHSLCAVWSSEVWENPNGGMLNSVHKARSRGSKLKCFGCGKPGATIGCHKVNCYANYHFACAKACGVIFTENHKLYCSAHKDCAKGDHVLTFDEPMKTLRVSGDKEFVLQPDSSCYRVGTLVIHSLGKIEGDNDGFHSENYITPPGFSSSRIYWSYMHEKRRTVYFMRIERSPKNRARFCLIAADDFNSPIESEDIFEVYKELMKRVSRMYKKYYSDGDMYSIYPMRRKKSKKKHYCLNGPQVSN